MLQKIFIEKLPFVTCLFPIHSKWQCPDNLPVKVCRTMWCRTSSFAFQQPADEKPVRYVTTGSKELLTLKLRYKQPDGDTSRLLEFPVTDSEKKFTNASTDFKFAAAVAEFGMLLRGSEFKGDANYRSVLELAQSAKGSDADGYRSEFLTLVQKARELPH